MSEKKITKAELRKMEKENLRAFTQKAFGIALGAIAAGSDGVRRKIQVRISGTNFNRYLSLSSYGRSCDILIFRDGNVTMKLNEFAHNPCEAQLFLYDPDEKAQAAFFEQFEKLLSQVIPVFWEQRSYDFHTFMDYVSTMGTVDEAYEAVENDFLGYDEVDQ